MVLISVVIPTKNRPSKLKECINSLGNQTDLPEEIIIVDDGDLTDEYISNVGETLPSAVDLRVTETRGEPGLSNARNTGSVEANNDVVLFLDDDVELAEKYIEEMREIYHEYGGDNLAGVGGFDPELRSPGKIERRIYRVLRIGGMGWRINEVGFQSWTTDLSSSIKSDWVLGNNGSYKRELLIQYPFQQWNGGREALEDVAEGLKLRNEGYHFIVSPSLSLKHHEVPDEEANIEFGVKYGRNRVRIFRTHCDYIYTPLFLWACLGEILRHFFAPLVDRRWIHHWTVCLGFFLGVLTQSLTRDPPR